MIASHTGDHAEVVRRLEKVIHELWISPVTHPEVFELHARSLFNSGRVAEAASLLEHCLLSVGFDSSSSASGHTTPTYLWSPFGSF